jgi:5-methylcytosine-specific restriction endonuclease McrA
MYNLNQDIQLKEQGDSVIDKICGGRRDVETSIVTTGHILKPPFKVNYGVAGGVLTIKIDGVNDSFVVDCNHVVLSPFRANQITFVTFDSERKVIDKKNIAFLSPLFLKILESFPPACEPFSSETLYEKIRRVDGKPQAHARRRWKDLKYNYGFDVDFDVSKNRYWRGTSEVPINDPELRPDDNKLRKKFLAPLIEAMGFADEVPHCGYCGTTVTFPKDPPYDVEAEAQGLLDHRRPVFQGGEDTQGNLQIFCQTCNNKKNSSCNNCPINYKCERCIWAFPEVYKLGRFVVYVEPAVAEKLRKEYGESLDEQIRLAIEGL